MILYSCQNEKKGNVNKWKSEIIETEQRFANMAHEKGVAEAFLAFADDEAVLLRNNNLIIGKGALEEYYLVQGLDENSSLSWEPEFVEVSESGDLGYTYGYYSFSFLDSTNNKVTSRGVFHTIWKKQNDGSWKFVWD